MMHPRGRRKPLTAFLRRDALRLPARMQTPAQNLLFQPSPPLPPPIRKTQQPHDGTSLVSLSELKRLSINSVGVREEQSRRVPRDARRTGLKYNRTRMLAVNSLSREMGVKGESLYDKSLRKANSALRRKDFEDSLSEISANKFLTSKRSLGPQEGGQRLKSELCQPESATIIIELKRLFKTRGEYNFVHNCVQGIEEKRDEQIFSTAHTYTYPHDRERQLSNTSNLHNRSRTAKPSAKERVRKGKPTKENQLIPWLRDTQRLSEIELEPFLAL